LNDYRSLQWAYYTHKKNKDSKWNNELQNAEILNHFIKNSVKFEFRFGNAEGTHLFIADVAVRMLRSIFVYLTVSFIFKGYSFHFQRAAAWFIFF